MTVTFTWRITNLHRTIADGKVITVHYSLDATDGTHEASTWGNFPLDGDLAIPFEDLTEPAIIGWVQDRLGSKKLAELEQALADQIKEDAAPTRALGLPW